MNTKLETLITSGRCKRPSGMFWYGPEGTRKTGTAVSSRTLILDLERGSDQYDVERIHLVTYRDLIEALDLVIRERTHHEIIVLDPIEVAEKLLIEETCKQLKIDGLQGLAHGAAWQFLRENFDHQLMARFNEVRRTGRDMIAIGHAQVRTVTLPGLAEPFDRWEPRIDKQNAAALVEWADHVLFFDWDLRTAKNKEGIVRAVSSAEPIIRVVHGAGWTAKNRVALTEPLKPEFAALAPLFASEPRPGADAVPPGAAPAASQPPAAPAVPPVQAPASRTIQEPPDPDTTPVEPFLSNQELRMAESFLSDLPQDKLLAFLRERNLINASQDFHALGPHYIRRILADPESFAAAVRG